MEETNDGGPERRAGDEHKQGRGGAGRRQFNDGGGKRSGVTGDGDLCESMERKGQQREAEIIGVGVVATVRKKGGGQWWWVWGVCFLQKTTQIYKK